MKKLEAQKIHEKDWSKHFVDEKDYHLILDEDVFVTKPNGDPLLVLLKKNIPDNLISQSWSVLKKFNPRTENRSTASGIDAQPRKKLDGTYSKTTRVPKGWEVISGVIGFFERQVRFPYGHACAWNQQNPEKFEQLIPLCEWVDEQFRNQVPDKWNTQKEICRRTHADYLIGDTVFTTLTVNKNFRTSVHKDAGDLPEGFSCMTVFKDGLVHGGNLVLPEYGIAAKLDHGDLIMFDPHEWHGNTVTTPIGKGSQRCSIVYYYREYIQYCKSMKEELEFAKNRKPGDKLFPEIP